MFTILISSYNKLVGCSSYVIAVCQCMPFAIAVDRYVASYKKWQTILVVVDAFSRSWTGYVRVVLMYVA